MKLLITCALLLVACGSVTVRGQMCGGTEVMPTLPDLNHDVSGTLWIENDRTYCIENFNYDGLGPDAFLYLYYIGDPTFIKGRGVITPVPGRENIRMGQFEAGRSYTNERLRFTVPEGHRTCDYGGFGIWCRFASQLFTVAPNLERFFDSISCTPSPGRAFLGSLPSTNNGISGDLFAVTDRQFAIREFTYDGQGGSDVAFYFFPAGSTASPASTDGVMIGSPLGSMAIPAGPRNITLPGDMDHFTCDFGTFAIWDGDNNSQFLASITINLATAYASNAELADHDRSFVHCDRLTTQPGVLVGELPTDEHRLDGFLYVRDDKTLYIELFSYDARGSAAYLYYYRQGQVVEDTGHGYRIGFSDTIGPLPLGLANSYTKVTPFIVNLNYAIDETEVNTCDLSWFTVFSETEGHYTRIMIPQTVFTTDPNDPGIAMRTRVLCTQTTVVPTPRTGGGAPTVSLINALSIALVAIVTILFRA